MQQMDFLKSPQENLGTWSLISKLLIYGAAATFVFLAILGATLV